MPDSELQWTWNEPHGYDCHRILGLPLSKESYHLLKIDMSFLNVSSETYREARKLFCSTNTFSFSSSGAPKLFLDKVPTDLISHIRSVRLEISLDRQASIEGGIISLWSDCLAKTISQKFVGIQTLNITIYLMGFVTCWRKSQHEVIRNLFRPLNKLTHLRHVTVILLEKPNKWCWGWCNQLIHDEDSHGATAGSGRSEQHLQRKLLMRQWAEEIRGLILQPQQGNILEGALGTVSLN